MYLNYAEMERRKGGRRRRTRRRRRSFQELVVNPKMNAIIYSVKNMKFFLLQ